MTARRSTTVRLQPTTWEDLESLRAELADSWLSECAGTQSEVISLVMAHGIAAVRHSIANPPAVGAPDSDTPPETAAPPPPEAAAAKTRARPARRLPVVKRKPDRRAEDGEPPAGKERRTKPRRRSDK